MRIYVLLFNARTDNEGIHTLQVGDRNVVLMFESEDDATRYALMLEAQDFGAPTPEAFDSEEIEEFCLSAGYKSKLIEEGQLELPPETNVESPDWSAEEPPGNTAGAAEPEDRTMSDSELDRIRRQLEGLL
jgi:Protein of unknown function (DUF3110)